MKTISLSFFFTFLVSLITIGQTPKPLDTGIVVKPVLEVKPGAVRLVYDELNASFLYSTVTGNIYEVKLDTINGNTETLLFDSTDHGIPYMQGMAIRDSQLVGCGNINAFKPLTTGRVSLAKLQPDGSWKWKVLAETEPYRSADYFDHLFSGIIISLTGDSVIWCSGARGDHGEVQDYYGRYPNLRGLPITDALLTVSVTEDSLILKDDNLWLAQNRVLYAKGTRNFFDFDYAPNGDLFALENSGDRDDPDEMNKVIRGAHYGYPWVMGGNDNPQQFVPFNPAADNLISPHCRAMKEGFFTQDTAFPKRPTGVRFIEPVKNYGPDADYFRDELTGGIFKASKNQSFITTFTAHRSPLGLAFDRSNVLKDNRYKGKGFMLSWTPPANAQGINVSGTDTTTGVFSGKSEDLILIEPHTNNYDAINCTRLVDGFDHPIDLVVNEHGIFVLESNYGEPMLYQVYFEKTTSLNEETHVFEDAFIYPNPCKEYFSIKSEIEMHIITLRVVDAVGQTVLTQMDIALNEPIDISTLNSGLYFVQLEDKAGDTVSLKLVKQ